MNPVDFRKKILEVGMQKHQAVINDFKQRIKEMMANDGNVNEEEYDSQVQAQKAVTSEDVSLLNEQLQFANREMEELNRIKALADTVHHQAEFGAVVETDKKIFFVSASLERIDVDGKAVYGMSLRSPIFLAMKGKKKGEQFSFKGKKYTIQNIY